MTTKKYTIKITRVDRFIGTITKQPQSFYSPSSAHKKTFTIKSISFDILCYLQTGPNLGIARLIITQFNGPIITKIFFIVLRQLIYVIYQNR